MGRSGGHADGGGEFHILGHGKHAVQQERAHHVSQKPIALVGKDAGLPEGIADG